MINETEHVEGAGWAEGQADFRRVFEENAQPMWVSQSRGIVQVNRAAVLHYGCSRDEFLALSIKDLGQARGAATTLRTLISTALEGVKRLAPWC
jgi:hypothetical protein